MCEGIAYYKLYTCDVGATLLFLSRRAHRLGPSWAGRALCVRMAINFLDQPGRRCYCEFESWHLQVLLPFALSTQNSFAAQLSARSSGVQSAREYSADAAGIPGCAAIHSREMRERYAFSYILREFVARPSQQQQYASVLNQRVWPCNALI
jgi:hypothetical protein